MSARIRDVDFEVYTDRFSFIVSNKRGTTGTTRATTVAPSNRATE